jgi:outer membrane protein assembly factor BamB
VWGDSLFLTFDGYDKQYVACLDKKTGEVQWKKERAIKWKTDNGDLKKAFSTPQVITVDGKPQLVSSAAEATIAYDPKDGKELWTVYHGGMNEACRPIHAHGLVYLTTGHVKGLIAVTPGSGDVTEKGIAWKMKDGPTRPSPVVVKDHIYVVNDDGTAFCLEAKTGKEVWKERLAGKCSASPVLIEGDLFCLTEDEKTPGKVEVIAASPTFNRVATNKLDAGGKGSPAAVGDALIIRTHTHLYCVGK